MREAGGQDAGHFIQTGDLLPERQETFVSGRKRREKERKLTDRHRRVHPSLERVDEQVRGLQAVLVKIRVRIEFDREKGSRVGGFFLCHVDVKVERHENRTVRSDRRPDGFQEIAFRILVFFRDHRAVQGEQERSGRRAGILAPFFSLFLDFPDAGKHRLHRKIIDVFRDRRSGLGVQIKERPDLIVRQRVNDVQKTRDLDFRSDIMLPDGFLAEEADPFFKIASRRAFA